MNSKKVTKKKAQKKYVENSMTAFETLGHTVMLSKPDDIWDFTTYYRPSDRYYAVWCTGNIDNQKSLIQVARNQLERNDIRLVVVCLTMAEKDEKHAEELDYCLCTLQTLLEYGNEMLGIKKRTMSGAQMGVNHGKVIVIEK